MSTNEVTAGSLRVVTDKGVQVGPAFLLGPGESAEIFLGERAKECTPTQGLSHLMLQEARDDGEAGLEWFDRDDLPVYRFEGH